MKESKFQTFFNKWLLHQYDGPPCVYEIKVCPGRTMGRSQIKDHQIRNLTEASTDRGLSYKIADVGIAQKPFDGFYVKNFKSWLVILFNKDKNDDRFFCLFNMKNWNDKSVTPEMCDECYAFISDKKIPTKISSNPK